MLIKNVRADEQSSDSDIMHSIFTLNDLSQFDKNDLKVVSRLKRFGRMDVVIEVTPTLRRFILARGYLWVSWKRAEVEDHLRILRCFNCCRYGHVSKDCKVSKVCGKCSENHSEKECTGEEKCANCLEHNLKYKTSLLINHTTRDSTCTVLNNYISRLKSRVAYN